MHELLFGGDSQSAGNLQPDIQSFERFKRTLPLDTRLKGLAVDELHDIEVLVILCTQIKHGGDIRMAQSGRSARLPKKPLARCPAIEVGGIDHLQGYGKTKVHVVRLVRDAHGSPTQFPKAAILPLHKLIVMVALNHGARWNREHRESAESFSPTQGIVPYAAAVSTPIVRRRCIPSHNQERLNGIRQWTVPRVWHS